MNAQFITDANGQRTAVILAIEDYARLIDDLREVEAICAHEATASGGDTTAPQAEAPPALEEPPRYDERGESNEDEGGNLDLEA